MNDHPRKLRIVDVNDQPNPELLPFVRHFEYVNKNCWAAVQDDFAKGKSRFADILIVDVSFDKDMGICVGAAVGDDMQKVPVGPLLALPYAAMRPVWSLAFYSAHLNNQSVIRFPWFLLPMGLLLAGWKRATFQSGVLANGKGADAGSLEQFIEGDGLRQLTGADMAVEEAHENYITELTAAVAEGRVVVRNATQVEEFLDRLQGQLDGRPATHRVPFGDHAHLELCWKDQFVDRIQLVSLCAEHFDWVRDDVNGRALERIRSRVAPLIGGADVLFRNVIRVFDKQNEMQPMLPGELRPPFHAAARHLFGELGGEHLREMLRLAVLLANVEGLAAGKSRMQKSVVWARLGLAESAESTSESANYQDLFGYRPNRNGAAIRGFPLGFGVLDVPSPAAEPRHDSVYYNEATLRGASDRDKRRAVEFLDRYEVEGSKRDAFRNIFA
jgi:hypothetical protein